MPVQIHKIHFYLIFKKNSTENFGKFGVGYIEFE